MFIAKKQIKQKNEKPVNKTTILKFKS